MTFFNLKEDYSEGDIYLAQAKGMKSLAWKDYCARMAGNMNLMLLSAKGDIDGFLKESEVIERAEIESAKRNTSYSQEYAIEKTIQSLQDRGLILSRGFKH